MHPKRQPIARPSALASGLLVGLFLPTTAIQAFTFQGLGDIPGGDTFSSANGISADGSVVVGSGGSSDGPEASRWTAATGMIGLDDLPGSDFQGTSKAASADGEAEAFRWSAATGMVGLGDLAGGIFASSARGTSADGSVIVGLGTTASGNSEAFRWTAASGMMGLGDLAGGFGSFAQATSSDGSVIVGGGRDNSGNIQAFRWTADGGMVNLGDLPGGIASAYATGVSADGSLVVGIDSSAVNTDEPFVWDATNGMRSLTSVLTTSGVDLTGWDFDGSISVSGDGTALAGTGTHNGITEAWLVTGFAAVPEPATWGFFLSGGLLIILIHRKRRQAGLPLGNSSRRETYPTSSRSSTAADGVLQRPLLSVS